MEGAKPKDCGQSQETMNRTISEAVNKNNAPIGPFGSRKPKFQHGDGQKIVGPKLDKPATK